MQIPKRLVLIVYLLAFVLLNIGCSKDFVYPQSDIQLVPSSADIIPSSRTVTDISESTINITLYNAVSCSVTGYDLAYETILGEPIESLAIINIPIEKIINGSRQSGTTTTDSMPVRPYTEGVMNLLESTTSSISPIRATVTVHFHDVNGNDFDKQVHFLCWKYTSSSE